VLLHVSCPDEACIVRASGSVNAPGGRAARRFKLRPAAANVPKGGRATLRLRVPTKALAAVRRALRRGKTVS
jgi:hypothetical protein